MNVFKFFLGLVLFFLVNCSANKEKMQEIISMDKMEIIVKKLSLIPPDPIEFTIRIYILDDCSQLHETDFSYLNTLYDLKFKVLYKSLSSFLYEVVNQRLKLKSEYFTSNSPPCELDTSIMKVYIRNRLEGVIEKYCTYDEKKNIYLLDNVNTLNQCAINTISYYFFINRYYIIVNDYANIISFSNMTLKSEN
jgi:hypothetical protein